MKITITNGDGIVLETYQLSDCISSAKREFPNEDDTTWKTIAIDELVEEVQHAIRKLA